MCRHQDNHTRKNNLEISLHFLLRNKLEKFKMRASPQSCNLRYQSVKEFMAQNLRSWIFLSIISACFLIIGELLGGRQGLLLGFILALSINFYLFFVGDKRVLKNFKVEILKGQDPWDLQSMVKTLSQNIRLGIPEIYVANHSTPFAFSIGRIWGQGKIVFSEGLLKNLTKDELKAVIIFQMVHIQKLYNQSSGLVGQLAELLFLGAHALDKFCDFLNIFTKKNVPIHFFQNLVTPLGVMLIRTQIKPETFLQMDLTTADLLHKTYPKDSKELMAEVLWKLHSYATVRPIVASPSTVPLFVVNPLTPRGMTRYFKFHPTIEDRIRNLVGQYPL